MKNRNAGVRLALAAGLTLCALPQAYAAGTTAGASINNTASVDYTVGGVNQPDVLSNTSTFLVDRRINLTVAEVGGAATQVVPGATGQVLTFTVTNLSNAALDFRLSAAQDANGATTAFTDTDNFDVTALQVFVDGNGNGTYDPGTDTATFIDELAADGTVSVFVVSSIPAGQLNGDTAGITLTAIAAQSTDGTGAYLATVGSIAADAAETNTTTTDNATFIDTVFGDGTGDTDGAADGRFSDDDEYDVVTAAIVVVKSSTVVSDPFNGTSFPKAIPGAVIEYCLDVNNTGAAAAGSIVLTDAIPANTTYVAGSITTQPTGTGSACDLGTGTAEDDDDTDGGDLDGAIGDFGVTAGNTVTVRTGSIGASARFKATFRVTVN